MHIAQVWYLVDHDLAGFQLLTWAWAGDFTLWNLFFVVDNVRVVTTRRTGTPNTVENVFSTDSWFRYEGGLFLWALK